MPRPSAADKTAELAFQLENVSVQFPGAKQPTIDGISLEIRNSEFLSLVGPSGCGKSTLLRLLAGLLSPSAGNVKCYSTKDDVSTRTGFVFQHPTLLPWRTAEANLQLPLELGGDRTQKTLTSAECRELLIQVGLSPADAVKRPRELSGGMQMRLSLARALATQPSVLLLDEPFAAVDDLLRLRLQEDVRHLHDLRGLTTILVTHNLQEAVFLSDRVMILSDAPAKLLDSILVPDNPRTADFRNAAVFHEKVQKISATLFSPGIL